MRKLTGALRLLWRMKEMRESCCTYYCVISSGILIARFTIVTAKIANAKPRKINPAEDFTFSILSLFPNENSSETPKYKTASETIHGRMLMNSALSVAIFELMKSIKVMSVSRLSRPCCANICSTFDIVFFLFVSIAERDAHFQRFVDF